MGIVHMCTIPNYYCSHVIGRLILMKKTPPPSAFQPKNSKSYVFIMAYSESDLGLCNCNQIVDF